tara:strand:+ start:65 stop:565 length:501 start_codon:yes stop_codon:yes gene_type:complete
MGVNSLTFLKNSNRDFNNVLDSMETKLFQIKTVTADTTLTLEDCGKVVMVNPAATTAITLPTLSSAIAGWAVKIIITEDTDGSDGGMGQIVNIDFGSGSDVVGMIVSADNVAGDYAVNNDDFINFTADASPGDMVDIFTDGNRWYVHGMAKDAAGSDVKFHTGAAS